MQRIVLYLLPCLFVLTASARGSEELSSILIRDVPHVRQKPDFCGEACLAMALQKHGVKADQDFVFDQSGLSPLLGRGCYTKELAQATTAVGFRIGKVWYRFPVGEADRSLDQLFQVIHSDLKKGRMSIVCMHYDEQPETTEHFRLIVGYDSDRDEVLFHEPAQKDAAYQRMARAKFLKLWPLKYTNEEWTAVLLRLEETDALKGEMSSERTDADYAQHIYALKKRLPDESFQIVLEKPFVVIGNETEAKVQGHATNTVAWAVSHLKRQYFSKDPLEIVDIWLFKDKETYEANCVKLFGRKPTTPYGYYSSADKALVMNISTGGGTLVHEIVHPFIESNFPDCPSWFNEGLASLYEQCREVDGRIMGSTNWRLNGLQKAISDRSVPPFETLCRTTRIEFYNEDPGTNYSQARYLCYYLQEHGLLQEYYHQFNRNCRKDPSGYQTLMKVLETQDMAAFKERWEAWTATLEF